MPYVDNDIPLATKRKWDDDDDETYNNKSPRTVLSPREGAAAPGQQQSFDASSISTTPTTRKTLHPTKRFRPIHQDSDSNAVHSSSHHRREQPSISPHPTNNKVISLLPCHVCHRRPTKKSDLDSFARCQACREQTCFICMRECQGRMSTPYSSTNKSAVRGEVDKGGEEEEEEEEEQALSRSFHMHDVDASAPSIPHTDDDIDDIDVDIGDDDCERRREIYTHHSMICSRCCVEKGAEGEVICLGCLADPCINTP
ncbi:hypothetical protein BBK36DRAFT_23254 [Trichoderma citrinoviride]|uniref:Uncharacterized protein n=1 Tax=Trichoderma citrinoviride TaxID=58853 RepID=A0A2T4B0W5_9HYPO|nr:hypothetical protein BBK36DRAFT_23254 [Trichoderma citrinoviride]PTB62940.1 hypothetical protein BBK36DRAFT_23254 [Trichoderma citrinoviride]